jgi:hypothetical protein
MPREPIPKAVKAITLHMRRRGHTLQYISRELGISLGSASKICREPVDPEVEMWLRWFDDSEAPWVPQFVRERYCHGCDVEEYCRETDGDLRREDDPRGYGGIIGCRHRPTLAVIYKILSRRRRRRKSERVRTLETPRHHRERSLRSWILLE